MVLPVLVFVLELFHCVDNTECSNDTIAFLHFWNWE